LPSVEGVEQVKVVYRRIMLSRRTVEDPEAVAHTPAVSRVAVERPAKETRAEQAFQSQTITLAAEAAERAPRVEMRRPALPVRAETVRHTQSPGRPRRIRAAAVEVCVQSLVYTPQVVELPAVRVAAVRASVLVTDSLRHTTAEAAVRQVTPPAMQALVETATKALSSFVCRSPKFLSAK
jgi:hypothetical protein